MQIAIMSDSHDHIPHLSKAIQICKEKGVSAIIHCGDFVAPFMLKELENANIPVHGVLGNNDGNPFELARLSFSALNNINLCEIIGEVDMDNTKIAYTHYRNIAEGLALSQKYHYVCYGHSHQFHQEKTGKTVLLNPGEIMGKNGKPSFCIIDTFNGEITRYFL
jgi:hypothetical protein